MELDSQSQEVLNRLSGKIPECPQCHTPFCDTVIILPAEQVALTFDKESHSWKKEKASRKAQCGSCLEYFNTDDLEKLGIDVGL